LDLTGLCAFGAMQSNLLHQFCYGPVAGSERVTNELGGEMSELQTWIERVILGSRWLLIAFYLGLAVGLAIFTANFRVKLVGIALTRSEWRTPTSSCRCWR
jgi:hypothetical protein